MVLDTFTANNINPYLFGRIVNKITKKNNGNMTSLDANRISILIIYIIYYI